MKHENKRKTKTYPEGALLPTNPRIVAFFFGLTPTESFGKNPCMERNEGYHDKIQMAMMKKTELMMMIKLRIS